MVGRRTSPVVFIVAAFVAALPTAPAFAQEPSPNPFRIDKDRAIFDRIEDGAPVRSEAQNPDEFLAYNTVLAHARQFPAADLEAAARRDVTFRDLFNPIRKDFKLELVYVTGRLQRLRSISATEPLREAGIAELYEGWLFPKDQPNPICVLVTDLPPGLAPQRDLQRDKLNVYVGVAGYSFKLMTYEASEPNPKDPTRGRLRQAPLLMGRSISVLPDTGRNPDDDWYGTFLPGLVGVMGLIAAVVFGLTIWYRRGDRSVRAIVTARQDSNPFAEPRSDGDRERRAV